MSDSTAKLLIVAAIAITGGAANAAKMLDKEPPEGYLRPGQHVLVNDGSCRSGQVKEIIGGSNRKYRTSERRGGAERTSRCVAKH